MSELLAFPNPHPKCVDFVCLNFASLSRVNFGNNPVKRTDATSRRLFNLLRLTLFCTWTFRSCLIFYSFFFSEDWSCWFTDWRNIWAVTTSWDADLRPRISSHSDTITVRSIKTPQLWNLLFIPTRPPIVFEISRAHLFPIIFKWI